MDNVQEVLDDVEKRIEECRSMAIKLHNDKIRLQETLNAVMASSVEVDGLSDVDREELGVNVDRLASRLETVQVQIVTHRTEEQSEALGKVDSMISELIVKSNSAGCDDALAIAEDYLNACSGGNGSKFEKVLLSCTSDDQKEVKKRLDCIVQNLRILDEGSGDKTKQQPTL